MRPPSTCKVPGTLAPLKGENGSPPGSQGSAGLTTDVLNTKARTKAQQALTELPLLKDSKLLDFKNNLRRNFFFIPEQETRHCQIYLEGSPKGC